MIWSLKTKEKNWITKKIQNQTQTINQPQKVREQPVARRIKAIHSQPSSAIWECEMKIEPLMYRPTLEKGIIPFRSQTSQLSSFVWDTGFALYD